MRHEARQVPSWLIFDVGQKNEIHVGRIRSDRGDSRCLRDVLRRLVCTVRSKVTAAEFVPSASRADSRDLVLVCAKEENSFAPDKRMAAAWLDSRLAALALYCSLGARMDEHRRPMTPEPNKAPEPTPTSVTPRADARVAPAPVVAHL